MQQISRAAVIWQLIAFGAVLLPHLSWLPAWLITLCLLTPAARLMIHSGRWPLPHWSLKALLVVLVAAGLVLTFSRETGMRATVALLIAGLALKMVEIYRRRDALVLLYVALFVCATGFLFHQSILAALHGLLAVLLVVAALNSVQQDPLRTDLLRPLKRALRLLAFSLPMMLVLFIVFPRIGPLWSVPLDRQAARTGLAEEMAPGDISRLTQSAQLAFRATFDGPPPPAEQRYWRSLVLTDFDGRTWRRSGPQRRFLVPEPLSAVAEVTTYEVIFEPTHQRWLVALDQPLGVPRGMKMGAGRTLVSERPLDRRISYRLQSARAYRHGGEALGRDLQLPDQGNPRARQQAQRWWEESRADPQLFVQRVLAEFNRRFVYTLTPPALAENSIDAFLFETRAGFCGHYAGALTFLLRTVGVPARVVVGYLGGEWNAQEGYLSVRQYDAHAWVEYWDQTLGWIRVDPTAAVAPERVQGSAEQLFADDPAFLADTPLARLSFVGDGWLVDLRRRLDTLNYNWARWVLNYQGRQTQLLRALLGEITPLRIIVALLLPLGLILGLVAWQQLRGFSWRRQDPLQRALSRLLDALAGLGLGRRPEESLQRYAARVAAERPELAADLRRLAQADEALRYAGEEAQRSALLLAIRACQNGLRKGAKRAHKASD